MKALEILKKIYANKPDTRFQRNNIDINFTIHDFYKIKEAIKELEALENRSCESCKHYDGTQTCNKFIARSAYSYKDFSCNKWESK